MEMREYQNRKAKQRKSNLRKIRSTDSSAVDYDFDIQTVNRYLCHNRVGDVVQ